MVQSAISYIRSIAFGGPDAPPPSNDDIPAYKKGSRDHNGQYEPSPVDVFIVREMLANFTKLPVEVVEAILDMAEYWPHSEASVEVGNGIDSENVAWGGGGQEHENTFLMRTYPIGMLDSHGGNLQIYGSSAKQQTPAPKPPQSSEYMYDPRTGRPDTRFPRMSRRIRLGRSRIALPVPPPTGPNPHTPGPTSGPTSRRMNMPVPPPVDFNWVEATPAVQPEPTPESQPEPSPATQTEPDGAEQDATQQSNDNPAPPTAPNPGQARFVLPLRLPNPPATDTVWANAAEIGAPQTAPESQPEAEDAQQDVDQSKSAAYSQDNFEAPDPELFAKLANYPLPTLVSPVRKIVFKIRSRDQGWGGSPVEGMPYHASWTWFDAGLEKLDKKDAVSNGPDGRETLEIKAESLRCVIPGPKTENNERVYNFILTSDDKMLVHKNKTASAAWQDHEVVWRDTDNIDPESDEGIALDTAGRGKASGTGEFVRSLEVGDVVTLWAKARFPGWTNYVEKASIKVYWAL